MEGTREASPDWLREFQAPLQTFTTLSSSPSISPSREPPSLEEREQQLKLGSRGNVRETVLPSDSEEGTPRKSLQKSKASKSHVGTKKGSARKNENKDSVTLRKVKVGSDIREESKKANGMDSSMLKVEGEGDASKMEVDIDDALGADEDIPEKRTEPRVASRLPLVFADKVHRSKALLECEGEALDFSGDVGAVGRLVVSKTSTEDNEILLDLKGTIYKTTIVPSYTFCVVNFGQSEAKIEAIMDDFLQLQPHSNVYETETMIEGTLDGYLFDSDDEGEKVTGAQAEQKNETTDIPDAKSTKKSDKQMVVETRFASHTIVLRRLVKVRQALMRMVTSNLWSIWRQSKTERAQKVKSMILDDPWWDRVDYLLSFTEPIMSMIRFTDMDRPCLGEIYDGIDSMIEKIKAIINAKEQDPEETFFKQVQSILIERWNKMTTPLHLLAFALNPIFYSTEILSLPGRVAPYRDVEVSEGYMAALARLFPDPEAQDIVMVEFGNFIAETGHSLVTLRNKYKMDAHMWWYLHGHASVYLQPLAIKVLAQAGTKRKRSTAKPAKKVAKKAPSTKKQRVSKK